jgi:hypothetical protein
MAAICFSRLRLLAAHPLKERNLFSFVNEVDEYFFPFSTGLVFVENGVVNQLFLILLFLFNYDPSRFIDAFDYK